MMRFILPAAAMNEDHVFMRVLLRWLVGLVLTLLLFFMADMFSRAYKFTWFPWQIQITDPA